MNLDARHGRGRRRDDEAGMFLIQRCEVGHEQIANFLSCDQVLGRGLGSAYGEEELVRGREMRDLLVCDSRGDFGEDGEGVGFLAFGETGDGDVDDGVGLGVLVVFDCLAEEGFDGWVGAVDPVLVYAYDLWPRCVGGWDGGEGIGETGRGEVGWVWDGHDAVSEGYVIEAGGHGT